jgi:hypothetical protein
VIVYSHTLSPRFQYIIHFLSDYFQHPFEITANEKVYNSSADFKINYSHQKINTEELYINPHSLLFENEKRKLQVRCFRHNGYTAFFETEGDVHFDLFAAIFFLLSRYEEYLPHEKDRFGLFAHQNSVAYKEGFLHQPLINIWLQDLKKIIEGKFNIRIPENKFSFLPTYDIDIAWSYKYRGYKLHIANIIRSLVKGDWSSTHARIKTAKGKQHDPYDAYEWMDRLHQKFNLNPIYFFLVAETKGKYDKNTNINNLQFQQLIKTTAAQYATGIHPSWYSGDHPVQLPKEKSWLESILKKEVTFSRQHYLRFRLPHTFQHLLNIGINEEYSMGYGSINGFRASIASSFYWYNLEKEKQTPLLIHPFCFMDANSFHEQKFSAKQALEELLQYYQSIKSIEGTMITIWHNNFLGTMPELEGWRDTYEEFIATVYQDQELAMLNK